MLSSFCASVYSIVHPCSSSSIVFHYFFLFRLMASSLPSESNRLWAVCMATIICVLSLLPSKLNGLAAYSSSGVAEVEERKLMILGSRPPQCVNKCFSCRPCTATLVIPPHLSEAVKTKSVRTNLMASSPSSLKSKQDDDDKYYLLSWKCRCKNKIYQP
ncbi:hypothetical protein C5167_027631 [Papaver somniferum]|nr:hypothetical protein C5167_027631 [Papaver somniferum]